MTISGVRLAEVTGVTFGGVPAAAIAVTGDTQVTATAPPHAAGAVDVVAVNLAGTSPVVAAGPFTYIAPPPVGPSISDLVQSRRRWNARKGTTFSFTLRQQASVTLAFTQTVPGRLVHGSCVALTKGNRKKPACKRTIKRGTMSFSGKSGANKLAFKGSLSRSKRLRPGRYTVSVIATDASDPNRRR